MCSGFNGGGPEGPLSLIYHVTALTHIPHILKDYYKLYKGLQEISQERVLAWPTVGESVTQGSSGVLNTA